MLWENPGLGSKKCVKCQKTKPVSDFRLRSYKGGYQNSCKDCYNEYQIRKRGDQREKKPAKFLLYRIQNQSRKKGIECDLDETDIKIPKKCPILGIPLSYDGSFTNFPSVDRIDNSKGYIKGNIIVVSWRANRLKSDATVQELRKISDFYEQNMKKPESRLQARIRLALESEIGGYWRKIHGSPFQRSGIPDIIGCVEGFFMALEVKRPGEDLTPLQELEIENIRVKGKGYAARVESPEQAVKLVKSALGRKRRVLT
jgi:hypothetical protein